MDNSRKSWSKERAFPQKPRAGKVNFAKRRKNLQKTVLNKAKTSVIIRLQDRFCRLRRAGKERVYMKKGKVWLVAIVLLTAIVALSLSACVTNGKDGVSIDSIEKTGTQGDIDIYTIYYSDGSTGEFRVTNGADGKDGESVTAQDIFEQYKAETGDDDLTFEEFVDKFMDVSVGGDNSQVIASALLSAAAVYTEFYESKQNSMFPFGGETTGTAVYTGSAVIYKIDAEYTYFITNYHVVYSQNGNDDNLEYSLSGASDKHIARRIIVYLYGSEGSPSSTGESVNGYNEYVYGDYAIECEYAGGSEENDLALLRAKTQDVKSINPDVQEVVFADGYDVGDTAVVIGNTGGDGISVTEGIVSVHSENINLQISSSVTSHRSMRVDAAMYGGNSGGGCFNVDGELIGVPHAGNGEEEQGINYAIPVDTVKSVIDNMYYYATDNDSDTSGAYKLTLGVSVSEENSRYEYDKTSGSGKITADTIVVSVTEGGIAEALGLREGDVIEKVIVASGGQETEYVIERNYMLSYPLYALKAGDSFKITYERDGSTYASEVYVAEFSEMAKAA